MKIAVYTIALNEESFVERWANSCSDADVRIVVDTGSTDSTVECARDYGCVVHTISVQPWRFDVARNTSLALVPDVDLCVALDIDEVLIEGWRGHLEALDPLVTRPRYKYTWSWNSDGTPGLQYGGDKIHSRYGYVWRHPVHEVLTPVIDEVQEFCDLEIHHHPDSAKSRSQYLPLLELACREDPHNDRNSHYLAREYLFNNELDLAAAEFKRHLSLPSSTWKAERGRSMRYLAQCEPHSAESWLLQAVAEDSGRREAWIDLAMHYYRHQNWSGCLSSTLRGLSITTKPLDYMCESFVWGSAPHDLAALSYYKLGNKEKAKEHGEIAVQLSPDDERLRTNLGWYV